MKRTIIVFMLLACPMLVFCQAVKLDTRGQLASFFKLSQNDLEINSKSIVATEKDTYTAMVKADTNTDGKITYSEYLNHLRSRA